MSLYDDEIFKYITTRDNFETAFEIYQEFPKVKNRLIEEFWLQTRKELEQITEDTIWNVSYSDIFDTYSHLGLKLSDKPAFKVIYEVLYGQTYFGLWYDRDKGVLNREKINRQLEGIEEHLSPRKSQWWIGWDYDNSNFSEMETLKKILPKNREGIPKEYAEFILELAENLKPFIEKFSSFKLE